VPRHDGSHRVELGGSQQVAGAQRLLDVDRYRRQWCEGRTLLSVYAVVAPIVAFVVARHWSDATMSARKGRCRLRPARRVRA
jgi:hypothetical protein